jgi:hypothetical protein
MSLLDELFSKLLNYHLVKFFDSRQVQFRGGPNHSVYLNSELFQKVGLSLSVENGVRAVFQVLQMN